ncbi:MAG: transporter [candidate division KSB1 bacterium]|nr:transporter [candidate division KSB1 bacterium]
MRTVCQWMMVCLLLPVGTGMAQPEPPSISTDRPDQSESPFIVPKRHFQIETGFMYTRATAAGLSAYDLATTLLRYGLSPRWEVRIGVAYRMESVKGAGKTGITAGLSGLIIGSKIHLWHETGRLPATAAVISLNLPAGNDAFSPSKMLPKLLLAMSHTLSDRFSLSYNLAVEQDEPRGLSRFFSMSLGMGLTPHAGAFVELYGSAKNGGGIFTRP